MKTKLNILILLSIILFGCKEAKKIEIIPDYDRIYLPMNQLTETPQLIEGDSKKLLDSVMNTYNKLYPFEDTIKNKPTMEYKFMISEEGIIEKVFLGKNNDETINQIVLTTISNWKFNPGRKDGKTVKSQYPMILWWETNQPINEDEFSTLVENMPGPIGGMYAIQEKIQYQETAKRSGIQGKVMIQAFIDENGKVIHTKILNGIGGGCDEVAVDAIKQTRFNPGIRNGKPVKVQVTILGDCMPGQAQSMRRSGSTRMSDVSSLRTPSRSRLPAKALRARPEPGSSRPRVMKLSHLTMACR